MMAVINQHRPAGKWTRLAKRLTGTRNSGNFAALAVLYALLIGIGFVFIFPLLVMLSASLKDGYDLINPLVNWIPTKIYSANFARAWQVLGSFRTVFRTISFAFAAAAAQTLAAALVGYGFAKYKFPLKNALFLVMIATFIIPDQVTFLSRYLQFKDYGMLETVYPLLIPPLFGQGMKQTVFNLIFYQFFRMSPKALDEAAEVDGAGFLRVFGIINIPLALPGILVVFVFSFVWHWNETYLTSLYFADTFRTMPLALAKFRESFERMFPNFGSNATNPLLRVNEGVTMAATLICIVPLVILYSFVERRLIESIDQAGITGE